MYFVKATCGISQMHVHGGLGARFARSALPRRWNPFRLTFCTKCVASMRGFTRGKRVKSKTAGIEIITSRRQHSGGVAHFIKTEKTAHRFVTYRSHTGRTEIYQHIVNLKTRQESIFAVIPHNGTSDHVHHLAGLHPHHPAVQMPLDKIRLVNTAVNKFNGGRGSGSGSAAY